MPIYYVIVEYIQTLTGAPIEHILAVFETTVEEAYDSAWYTKNISPFFNGTKRTGTHMIYREIKNPFQDYNEDSAWK